MATNRPLDRPRLRAAVAAACAAAAGIVLALALPAVSWWPLALLMPGLLLEAIGLSRSAWTAAGAGLVGGLVHWTVTVHWVVPVMADYGGLPIVLAVICLLLMAAALAVPWALVAAATYAVPVQWRIVLLPIAWTALEGARQALPYRFPWNPVAAGLVDDWWTLGSLPVWGASGLGWTVLAIGAALWALVRTELRAVGRVALVATAVAVGAATLAAPPPRPSGAAITVALLQPGGDFRDRWNPANWSQLADRVWDLTRSAAALGADLAAWPEGAMPYRADTDPVYRARLVELATAHDMAIVLNSVAETPSGYANAVFAVSPGSAPLARYDKVRLVPFGEYVPAIARFALAESLVREVSQFTPGERVHAIDAGGVRLAVALCYEIVFADLVAAGVRDGGEVILTITNDAWYGRSWAPRQHFAQAVLRAVECRRWVVRAALTGISGAIAPNGMVTTELDTGRSGLVHSPVRPCDGLTPRVRWGDWWAGLCALASVAILVAAAIRHRRPL
jgi:apolipoprotein N-acyltransferase